MEVSAFKRLQKDIKDRLVLDEDRLYDSTMRMGTLYQDYLEVYISELADLKGIMLKMDKLYGHLYDKYKNSSDKSWTQKGEIESQIYSNDDYHMLRVKKAKQEVMVKFLEESLSNIKSFGFTIKNTIELKKMQRMH